MSLDRQPSDHIPAEKQAMSTASHNNRSISAINSTQWQKVASLKIFFGHQSVGDNLLAGLRELQAGYSSHPINVISSDDPASIAGPALIDWHIGQNGDPSSKDAAFREILDKGFGRQAGVAFYKYCFVDIGREPDSLFRAYSENTSLLRARYPNLVFVHVTIPLTTVEPEWKAWTKRKLGRQVERDTAVARHHFNQLLRTRYRGNEPIFDLAGAESTQSDGTRSFFVAGGEKVETLAAQYTSDGGHLNHAGQRATATKLILALAQL